MPADVTKTRTNVADRLTVMAKQLPSQVAIACAPEASPAFDVQTKGAVNRSYAVTTFADLDYDATVLARGLVSMGVTREMRIAMLVKPGIEFVTLVFALLRCGATIVLVDPGMGRKHLISCLASAKLEGMIGIPQAHVARCLFRRRLGKMRLLVTVGRRWFWSGVTLNQLRAIGEASDAALPHTTATDQAAIIFTSGSTGPPKGVLYTHQMFDTQVSEIASQYEIAPGGIDMSCFPLFGLFNSAMGVTTVLPDMDFAKPASADPVKLLAAANDWQVTQAFASPAVWANVSQHCRMFNENIPSLQNVFSCGAPVPASVLESTLACVHPEAKMHTPYGATECLPIASIEAAEVLGETASKTNQGAGICVGRRSNVIDWRVVRISDEPITSIDQCKNLPEGEIGELLVRGPQASPRYETAISAGKSTVDAVNAQAKVADGETVWHRMGDVGYFDDQQRFWYCGRKSHRVETESKTHFTIPCEAVFNTCKQVKRSAIVKVSVDGKVQPALVVELIANNPSDIVEFLDDGLVAELQTIKQNHSHLQGIRFVLLHPALPVDVRHNAKINRELLSTWANEKLVNRTANLNTVKTI